MDKYIDENNGLWYEVQGDYYIPCLILSEEETQPIGLWGQRHKQSLYTTKLKVDNASESAMISTSPSKTEIYSSAPSK